MSETKSLPLYRRLFSPQARAPSTPIAASKSGAYAPARPPTSPAAPASVKATTPTAPAPAPVAAPAPAQLAAPSTPVSTSPAARAAPIAAPSVVPVSATPVPTSPPRPAPPTPSGGPFPPVNTMTAHASRQTFRGIPRTAVPTVKYAPGTTPYFSTPPKPVVVVTDSVYQPWTFSISKDGIAGKQVAPQSPTPVRESSTATRSAPAAPAAPRAKA